jgi:CDP-archaeol synthase
MSEFLGLLYLFLPLVGGAAFHGLCMKYDLLKFLAYPVDRGKTFRGKLLFGPNKTIRGIVCVGVGTAILFGLQADLLHSIPVCRSIELFDYSNENGWLLGFAIGTSAMLSELPNSFVKRQLNVVPGESARGPARTPFYLFDQLDLLLGVWIVLAFVLQVTIKRVALSIIIIFVMHQLVTQIGYVLGVRGTRR